MSAENRLPFARSFQELMAYQKARALSQKVFETTKRFPREEAFSLTSQWRRAARSVGAQISEAWAKRRYPAHFTSKLTDGEGEVLEVQHWTLMALDCGYIDERQAEVFRALTAEIGAMLGSMIRNADSFCGEGYSLREERSEYFACSPSLNTEY